MPDGMRRFVRDLRRVPVALGDGVKRRLPSEERPLVKMGKKLVAARELPAGHVLAEGDLAAKSPADGGLPPYELDRLLGKKLRRPLALEQDVALEDVELAEDLAARGRCDRPPLRPRRTRRRRHGRPGPARIRLRRRPCRAGDAGRDLRHRLGRRPRRRARLCGRRHRPRVARAGAARGRGGVGRAAPARQQRRPRLAARCAGRGGRPVRDLPGVLVRRGHGRQRQGHVPLLPGRRRRDGAGRAGLDRERLLDLRAALSRAGPVCVPARSAARRS